MNALFHFSGIYEYQEDLTERLLECGPFRYADLRKMSGVNGYCSKEAEEELKGLIRPIGPEGIHFLDNGNFHYVSKFFLENIGEPFELIVFDHHTDMQPAGLIPCLSCGNWVLESIADAEKGKNRLNRVYLAGPPDPGEFGDLSDLEKEGGLPVYISVDKDVLAEREVRLNWDQGNMSTETLLSRIEEIAAHRRVIGMDICGEPVYNMERGSDVKRSEEINFKLFEVYRCL